jgi:hypothetical protein
MAAFLVGLRRDKRAGAIRSPPPAGTRTEASEASLKLVLGTLNVKGIVMSGNHWAVLFFFVLAVFPAIGFLHCRIVKAMTSKA